MVATLEKRPKSKATSESSEMPVPVTMKPEIVTFVLVGVSPLLQNNPAEFIGKNESGGGDLGKKKEYNDEEEARLRLYLDGDGNHCHPTEAFLKSIVKAARGKKFGKAHAAQLIMGSVFVAEQLSVIEDARGKPATKYTIDRRSVVIGKSRVLRCRPSWSPWRVRVALEIDTAMITPKQICQTLSLAGRTIGVGDYRPEKGGGFGRFMVEMS